MPEVLGFTVRKEATTTHFGGDATWERCALRLFSMNCNSWVCHQTYGAPTCFVRGHVRADIRNGTRNYAAKFERLAARALRGYEPLIDLVIIVRGDTIYS